MFETLFTCGCSPWVQLVAFAFTLAAPLSADALSAPQDNWELIAFPCCGVATVNGADFDRQGNIFVATATPDLEKRDPNGALLGSVAIPTSGTVRVGADNSVYVSNPSEIIRFGNNLTPLPSIPIAAGPSFDVDQNGLIVTFGNPPRLYGSDGTFIRQIGSVGGNAFAGNVSTDYQNVVFDRNGNIIVKTFESFTCYLLTFSLLGEVTRQPISVGGGSECTGVMRAAASGLVLVSDTAALSAAFLILTNGSVANSLNVPGFSSNNPLDDFSVSPSGDILFFNRGNGGGPATRGLMKTGFRSQQPLLRPRIPQPRVLTVNRRPGTTINDIDFIVSDEDDTTVSIYPLALRDGVFSLANAVKMQALIEGTVANVGSVSVYQSHRISWDAAQDLGTAQPFVSADIVFLAKDGRGIVDFDFVEIPANIPNAGNPVLKMTRSPLSDTDLLNAWLWLVASNDNRISFTGGQVLGVSGPYAGQLLASGTTTTTAGRGFLFGILGVREATAAEIVRAREATTPGFVNQYPPRAQMGGLPVAVNQFGIDTGSTGYWIVMP